MYRWDHDNGRCTRYGKPPAGPEVRPLTPGKATDDLRIWVQDTLRYGAETFSELLELL